MFWAAVGSGLSVLLHYQVWIGAAVVVVVSISPMLTFMRTTSRVTTGVPDPVGCLTTMIGGTILQGIAVSVYLTTILPIILGGTGLTPLSFIADHFGTIAIAGGLGVVAMVLVSLVPIVGSSQTFATFVQGIVVCRTLAGGALEYAARYGGGEVVYPGLLASIGFVMIAVVLARLAILLLAVTSVTSRESSATFLGPPLGLVFGLLPVFMYMRYAVMSLLR